MNPVIALALLLAAGLAATHLPFLHPRRFLSLDLALTAGPSLVLAGIVLGPFLGILDRTTLNALAPVTALGIGWLGAMFGAQLEARLLRRIPRRVWVLAALQAVAALVLTVVAARLLIRLVPALIPVWRPRTPALLTLGAIAIISGPAAVAVVARTRALARAALIDTAFGTAVFAFALGLSQPHRSFAGAALGWAHWVAVAVTVCGGVGMLFVWLSRLRGESDNNALALDLLATILLGAGLGYAADLSPFVVCALATALIVNLSPLRRRVRALLATWEQPVYAAFLVLVGALLDAPTLWLVAAALALGVVRVAARWALTRYGRLPYGLATVAQGGVPLALALSFNLIYAGSGGSLLTTALIGVALAHGVAVLLMALALRPAPAEVS